MKKNGIYISCRTCNKKRRVTPSVIKSGRGKYCSKSCASKQIVYAMHKSRGESWKNNISKGINKLYSTMDESDHPRWKGDNVGYFGVHDWISKHFGQPKECKECGMKDRKRMYHWANLTGKYLRNIKDWKRMCVSCHRKYDYERRKYAPNFF